MNEPMTLSIDGPHEADHRFIAFWPWPEARSLGQHALTCARHRCYFTPEAHRQPVGASDREAR